MKQWAMRALLLLLCLSVAPRALAAGLVEPGTPWFDAWVVESVERHPEYLRVWVQRPDGERRSVEIVSALGPADAWSTSLHRVQPLPGEEADTGFMEGSLALLQARGEELVGPLGAVPEVGQESPDRSTAPRVVRERPAWVVAGLGLWGLSLSLLMGWVIARARPGAPERAPDRSGAPVALALAGLALGLRWAGLSHGWMSDEVALLQPGGPLRVLFDPLTAVNPPLHRLPFSLLGDPVLALELGRGMSMICGVLAAPMAFALGRRLDGARVGLFMGLVVALLPVAVQHASVHRVYALWLLTALVHVHAVVRVARSSELRRGPAAQLAISALLLTQLHYLAVPALLLEGLALAALRGRGTLWLWAPAVWGLAPWTPLVLSGRDRWLAPQEGGLLRAAELALGFGLGPSVAALVLLAVAAHAWRWRSLDRARRALLLGALGALASVLWVGSEHYLTSSVGVVVLPWALPVLAGGPSLLSGRLGRWTPLCWLPLLVVPLLAAQRLASDSSSPQSRDSVERFASSWRSLEPMRQVMVSPDYQLHVLHLSLTGELIQSGAVDALCHGQRRCFVVEGVRFLAAEAPPDPGTVWVAFGDGDPAPEGCDLIETGPRFMAWRCP